MHRVLMIIAFRGLESQENHIDLSRRHRVFPLTLVFSPQRYPGGLYPVFPMIRK
jgi:hypothetical protein